MAAAFAASRVKVELGATAAAGLMRDVGAFSSTATLNLEGLLRENGYWVVWLAVVEGVGAE